MRPTARRARPRDQAPPVDQPSALVPAPAPVPIGHTLPGNYCAFLLDPSDPTKVYPAKVYLDALATSQGQVIPVTEP